MNLVSPTFMKKSLFILLLIFFSHLPTFATFQTSDILLLNNDTLNLYKSPLENFPDVRNKIFNEEDDINTDCEYGFFAEWVILNDTLYLQNIYNCQNGKKINQRLEKIMNRKFVDGRLKADWYTGELLGGYGRYLSCIYYVVYEKERLFIINGGKLENIRYFDARNIEYSIDKNVVEEFVYKNFNWEIFNSKDEFNESVYVSLSADKAGNIESLNFENSSGSMIEKEVERVLRLIPNWGTYYWHAGIYAFSGGYNLRFNNETMSLYTH